MTSHTRRLLASVIILVLASPCAVGSATAKSAQPRVARAWEPAPHSEPLFEVQAPTDANGQRHIIEAEDGIEIFVETWLPAAKDGRVPPERVPTIVVMSPYHTKGAATYASAAAVNARDHLVRRGYAWAHMHARGRGSSEGCFEDISRNDIEDGLRVLEYLGRDAPWSNGIVGAYGLSQDGGRPFGVAALGDPDRTRYLKAMVLMAPMASRYATSAFDGVPYPTELLLNQINHTADSFLHIDNASQPDHGVQRFECQPEHVPPRADLSGNMTPYLKERELRRGVKNVRAATLMFQGHRDTDVEPIVQAGLFDQLPADTTKKGVFGVFDHETPAVHSSGVRPEWERPDFLPMVTAWFDRYLKGLSTGVERWPTAQVQGTDGLWRAEPGWPSTSGTVGQLALGADGTLGSAEPKGSTSYTESAPLFHDDFPLEDPGGEIVFQSGPLPGRLEITGQPVLDLWVTLNRPDAHLAAQIETFDAEGSLVPYGVVQGFRSMQHLAPLIQGRFAQEEGVPAPVGEPVRVSLRFQPTDLVVPKGGSLRVRLGEAMDTSRGIEGAAGAPVTVLGRPSWPSLAFTTVTVLHDCAHPSALRFEMPRPGAKTRWLNVREKDEQGPLRSQAGMPASSDGGGLAVQPVCGLTPPRIPMG